MDKPEITHVYFQYCPITNDGDTIDLEKVDEDIRVIPYLMIDIEPDYFPMYATIPILSAH